MSSKISLEPLKDIDGYIASGLVDCESGMLMAGHGSGVNLEVAAAGNAEVIKSKRKVLSTLKLNEQVEDVLITLDSQYHLLRPLEKNSKIMLYLALERSRANLAMARHELRSFEATLDLK